jgi:TonB family protein
MRERAPPQTEDRPLQVTQPSAKSAPNPTGIVPKAAARIAVILITPDDALWRTFTAVPGASNARQFDSIGEFLGQWGRTRPAVVALDARATGDLATALDSIGSHGAALVTIALVDEPRRVAAAALERQRRLFEHLLLPLDPGTAKSVLDHASEEAAARQALLGVETATPTPAPTPAPEAVREARPAAKPAEGARASADVPATVTPLATAAEASRPRVRRSDTVPVPQPAAAAVAQRPSRMPRPPFIAALLIAVATLAAATWWSLARPLPGTSAVEAPAAATLPASVPAVPGPASRPSGAPAQASAALTRASVDEQVELALEKARNALRERRYIDPLDDNALSHYKTVLALDPANGEALQGQERIAEVLLARAAAALAAHDNAGSLRTLEAARAIAPSHPRLAGLDAQVNARAVELSSGQVQAAMQAGAFGRASTLLNQAERAGTIAAAEVATLRQDIARRTAAAQLADLARLVQARISQGQLIEPQNDNAKGYLASLSERGGPAMADEVARLTDLYQKRVVSEARTAMAAGAWTQADAWVAELRSTRGGGTLAQSLQKDVERRSVDARAPAAAEPPPTPGAIAPSVTPLAVPAAATLAISKPAQLAKPLKVVYPRDAALRNASGWVMVEVEIDAAGKPGSVRVLDASPPGLFDAAAVSAVQHGTFVPATAADGSHQRTTVSMRVRFQLDDRS